MRSRLFGLMAIGVLTAATAGAQGQGGGLDCLTEPYVIVAVGSPADGVLEDVKVDRGDVVAKGDVIATLESSIEKANVALARARTEIESSMQSARSRHDFGVRRFQRTDELFKKDLVPLREMDEAETQMVLAEIGVVEAKESRRIAELELHRAETVLAVRTIKSPVNGVVTERVLSAGEFTKQGAIVKIAQLDPLRVEVIVPVAMLGRIAPGMRASIVLDPPLRATVPARVKVADRVVDAASGTFGVRLEVPNANFRIPAGIKCKVRFFE
jgi:RND family efflux transporter MFP subunit